MFSYRRLICSSRLHLRISLLINAAFFVCAVLLWFNTLQPKNNTEIRSVPSENGWKVRNLCENQLQVLFVVHTATDHTKQRELLRQTLGSKSVTQLLNSTLLFLVGKTNHPVVNVTLHAEAKIYGDVVILPFLDTYKNLTLKFLNGIRWAVDHCGHTTKLFVKLDDDALVNPFLLNSWLQSQDNTTSGLQCAVYSNVSVVRDPRSKWHVSPQEYTASLYPNYCAGVGYIMSPSVAWELLQTSQRVPFFWIDDVYATGMLAEAVGIPLVNMTRYYDFWPSPFPHLLRKDVIFYHLAAMKSYSRRNWAWSFVLSDNKFRYHKGRLDVFLK